MTESTIPGPSALGAATRRRVVWLQRWSDVLFLHWRVPAADLRCCVPAELAIDENEGEAWVSLVLFKLKVRPIWLPFLPGFSNLLEVNLRTYVRYRDQPGITFLSVHAENRLAIFLARRLTPMPYQWASMKYARQDRYFQFDGSDRAADGWRLSLRFAPHTAPATADAGSLDAWLLERYHLFLADGRRRLQRAEVEHPPWQVQGVELWTDAMSAGARFGLDLARSADLAHFSPGVQARFGTFESAEKSDLARLFIATSMQTNG